MNNPFRYAPSEEILAYSRSIIEGISSDPHLHSLFAEGKMLGVLEVEDVHGHRSFLKAFSGLAGGHAHVPGFVPPVFDLTVETGYFKKEEAAISRLARGAKEIVDSREYLCLRESIDNLRHEASEALSAMRAANAENRARRSSERKSIDIILQEGNADDGSADAMRRRMCELDDESRRDKARLHALALHYREEETLARQELDSLDARLLALKKEMKARSDALQGWIFEQFIFHNGYGDCLSIKEIFARKGMIAPSGTGECAAPKLLEYAFRHSLRPVSMGEFWYGLSSGTHVQGRFYPSCQSKCSVLLDYMLSGVQIEDAFMDIQWPEGRQISALIVYEDEYLIVADKPSGMLAVPGKTGNPSLQELLEAEKGPLYPAHRLDMDTSGLIVFARTPESQAILMSQFESRQVVKEYMAVLDKVEGAAGCDAGIISLPLATDYENRPSCKVDMRDGREAVTEFRVTGRLDDGRIRVVFHPLTGRTHQLRLHSAHPSGLCRTISGDRIYGSPTAGRLCLQSYKISFRHPIDGHMMSFSIPEAF